MSSKNDQIEECCDALAEDIEQVGGKLTDEQVSQAIDQAVQEAGVERNEFLETFRELYECNPFVYAENARDDAMDAQLNPREEIPVLDMDDDLMDLQHEGLIPLQDGEY